MTLRLEPLSLEHLDGIMTWVNDPGDFYFARLGKDITREEEVDIRVQAHPVRHGSHILLNI